jgi:hypothetical protein
MIYFSLAVFIFVVTAFMAVYSRREERKNIKENIVTEREVSEYSFEEIE